MTSSKFTILIPTDFSEQSLQALKYAQIIAQSIPSEITLVYVIENAETSSRAENGEQDTHLKNSINQKFEDLIDSLENFSDEIAIHQVIEKGKVYDKILEVAARVNAQLLIMGCNSAGDYKNRFLGSNSLRIMRSCPVPVISANNYSQLAKLKNIILPVDLSKDSNMKLNKAIAFAKINPDIVLHIISVVFDADEFLVNRLGQQLVKVKEVIEKKKIKYTAEIIKANLGFESLGEILADYSRKIEGDVIMLMTQQEINHTPYFVSSLAQEIINISELPVMTIAPN